LLPLTPELAFRFQSLWAVVAYRRTQRPEIRLPFYHLQTDGIWASLALDGTPAQHPLVARFARIDPDFVAFVADASNRGDAKRVLVRGYFTPAERVALAELVGIPAEEAERLAAGENPVTFEEVVRRGREARFRLRVVAAYNYTCALTGYRLATIDGATIVDAAHIHRFADSGNNDPRNGLALCKNAHWCFDQGLWTLSDSCEILVATDALGEAGPEGMRLVPYQGRQLTLLPADPAARPDPAHVAWHRRNVYLGELRA
jgi:putative restriction endonuclease